MVQSVGYRPKFALLLLLEYQQALAGEVHLFVAESRLRDSAGCRL